MESWIVIGGIALGLVALILHAGRNDDSSESGLRSSLRGLWVLGSIAAVAGAIIWVSTYGT